MFLRGAIVFAVGFRNLFFANQSTEVDFRVAISRRTTGRRSASAPCTLHTRLVRIRSS